MTPLHTAVESACVKVVEYLVDQESDVNFQDHAGVKFPTCDPSNYTEYELSSCQISAVSLFLYSAV